MRLAEKWEEVMLTDRMKGDILDDNQLIPILGRIESDLLTRIDPQASTRLFVEIGDTLGSADKPLAGGILADPLKDQPDSFPDFGFVNRLVAPAVERPRIGRCWFR